MNILIYRPQPAASRTASVVEEIKIDRKPVCKTFIHPLFNIEPTGNAIPQADYDNLIITSAGVFEVGLDFTPYIYTPLYVVGKRTREAAHDAGFITVHTPTATSLALSDQLMRSQRIPQKWLYLAGVERKKDLEQRLTQAGYNFTVTEVYHARAVDQLPTSLSARLQKNNIDIVLHYSARSAIVFLELIRGANLMSTIMDIKHVVMSERIKSALSGIPSSLITVASYPDEDEVMDVVKEMVATKFKQ